MTIEFEKGEGLRISKEGISLVLHLWSATKIGAKLNAEQVRASTRAYMEYMCSLNNLPIELLGKDVQLASWPKNMRTSKFYKVVDKNVQQYLESDTLQLGSITYYRGIEKAASKDPFEGLVNLMIAAPNRHLQFTLSAGYNFGILCGFSSPDHAKSVGRKFGTVLIEFEDISDLAQKIQTSIDANSWFLDNVQYTDLKYYEIQTKNSFNKFVNTNKEYLREHSLDDALFKFLYKHTKLPSIFVKPISFRDEKEVRLAFELPGDYTVQPTKIDGLNKHIKIVEILK